MFSDNPIMSMSLDVAGPNPAPYTEKFFRAAGLAPGMRVLEVGSGMGDVALLSADIVGPGGRSSV